MSIRYATIITDDDGREVVSAIGEFESAAPFVRAGGVEQIPPGVLIGMVKGGPVDAVSGFGFPQGSLGVDGSAIGIAMAKLNARPDADAALRDTPAEPKPDAPARARKPKPKSRRAKSVRAKAGKKAKSGKGAAQPRPLRQANAAKQAEPGEAAAHG